MSNNFDADATKGYPKTKNEWWRFVDYYLEPLRDLVANYHPCYARWGKPLPITAHGAEAVCETIRENIEKEAEQGPLVSFDRWVKERNPQLVSLLNQTWFGVPESRDAHSLPGFGVLCDLCSEAYVLDEEF